MSTGELFPSSPKPNSVVLFEGSDRTLAAVWYSVLCLFSIGLHGFFIMGARKLSGWTTDFAFTLLLTLSAVSLVRFIAELVASVTSLFYMDWLQFQILWIALGSLAYASYFSIVLLNLAIAIHRLIYTAFPFTASSYLNEHATKTIFFLICTCFVCFVVVLNTPLLGIRWMASAMSWSVMKARNGSLLRLLNRLSNYFVGVLNLVLYTLLMCVLACKRMISFRRNHEIRMTLQVLCMVVIEMAFFFYWEYVDLSGFGLWNLVVAETTNLLFFDVLILPYLILNKRIHTELKSVFLRNIRKVSPHNSTPPFVRATPILTIQ
ncbi:hypothetical protein Q1695_002367 [Nippostrongylus brasiliensis]|nr:hypothetical protein Q1695_002367 [Nippostrongylus brasiliensis]